MIWDVLVFCRLKGLILDNEETTLLVSPVNTENKVPTLPTETTSKIPADIVRNPAKMIWGILFFGSELKILNIDE